MMTRRRKKEHNKMDMSEQTVDNYRTKEAAVQTKKKSLRNSQKKLKRCPTWDFSLGAPVTLPFKKIIKKLKINTQIKKSYINN